MRSILSTVAFFLASTVALAQTPPVATPGARVAWDHDRVSTDRFEGQIDGGASGVTHQIGLPATNIWTLPAMTAGNHTVAIRACNAAGCSAWSTALAIQVIVVPGVPSNLRLAPATINNPAAQVAPRVAPNPVARFSPVPAVPIEPRFE